MKIEKLNGGYSDSLNVGDIVTPKHKPGAAWTVERIKPFTDAALMDESRPLVYFKTESGEKSCWLFEKLLLTSHSELQAVAQLASIREMVKELQTANAAMHAIGSPNEAGGKTFSEIEIVRSFPDARAAVDAIEKRIQEDPLSVEVRSGWETLENFAVQFEADYDYSSAKGPKAAEFRILLCTGGPAVQIVGSLDQHCEPASCRLEHQDWGTPWTEYRLSAEDQEVLLQYASCFYFGS